MRLLGALFQMTSQTSKQTTPTLQNHTFSCFHDAMKARAIASDIGNFIQSFALNRWLNMYMIERGCMELHVRAVCMCGTAKKYYHISSK